MSLTALIVAVCLVITPPAPRAWMTAQQQSPPAEAPPTSPQTPNAAQPDQAKEPSQSPAGQPQATPGAPDGAKPSPEAKPSQEGAKDQPAATPPPAPAPADQTAPAPDKPAAPAATPAKKPPRKRKSTPARKVVRDGSTADTVVEISPGMSQQQATTQRQTADQLIAATEVNLKKIEARQLQPNEQETVGQIHNYLEQARTALKAGDLERSRNLAFKANLLSADLLPH